MENREPIQYRDGEDRTKLVDQAVALLDLYVKEPAPECVVAVEEPLLVPLFNSRGEALEKPLLAIPDLIARDNGELVVTEFKTSGRRFGELEAEGSLQASCYAHAVQDRYDEQPSVRYTILVKTKTPQIQHLGNGPQRCRCNPAGRHRGSGGAGNPGRSLLPGRVADELLGLPLLQALQGMEGLPEGGNRFR